MFKGFPQEACFEALPATHRRLLAVPFRGWARAFGGVRTPPLVSGSRDTADAGKPQLPLASTSLAYVGLALLVTAGAEDSQLPLASPLRSNENP